MKQADIVKGDKYAVKIGQDLSVAHYVGHDRKKKQGRFKMLAGGIKCVPYQSVKALGGPLDVEPKAAKPKPSPSKKHNKASGTEAQVGLQNALVSTMKDFEGSVRKDRAVQEANGHAEKPQDAQGSVPPGLAVALAAALGRMFDGPAQQRERRFPRRGDMVAIVFHKECAANGGGLDIDASGTLIERLLSLDANGWRTVHAGLYDQDQDFRARFLPPAPSYV